MASSGKLEIVSSLKFQFSSQFVHESSWTVVNTILPEYNKHQSMWCRSKIITGSQTYMIYHNHYNDFTM